ncbi:DUF4190 domain-containing protein [Nocardioides sp. W7]|uniref:DUF4190 domain-containing protein n=1 Tax=Nocardioides sp. W7 TaxID=2931390 RepID=UPI001FD17DBD|nr:DUF4190 domain-containing protein [Nocardioides sp. W7]
MTQPPQYPGTPEPPEEQGATPPPLPPAYGAPQPPPPPYGAPQQPPAYGAPQQPPTYGAPQQPPAYGAPQQPPPYGNPYGGSAFPTGPAGNGANQPSKGLAIAALVLSFLACTFVAGLVSIALAIVVLVRGKDGRNHGKGLAVAAIIVSIVMMAVSALGIVGLVVLAEEQSIDNLETGQCINADELTDADSKSIGLIDKVSCSEEHDGEVVATSEITTEQAGSASSGIDCSALVDPDLLDTLNPDGFAIYGLTQDTSPEVGDAVACVAVRIDGSKLTERLG